MEGDLVRSLIIDSFHEINLAACVGTLRLRISDDTELTIRPVWSLCSSQCHDQSVGRETDESIVLPTLSSRTDYGSSRPRAQCRDRTCPWNTALVPSVSRCIRRCQCRLLRRQIPLDRSKARTLEHDCARLSDIRQRGVRSCSPERVATVLSVLAIE